MVSFFGSRISCLIFFLFSLNLLFGSRKAFSQEPVIDSLMILLEGAKEDTSKAKILNELSAEFLRNDQYEKALRFAQDALAISLKKNFHSGSAFAYSNIGTAYREQSKYEMAIENYMNSIRINEKIGEKRKMASLFGNIAIVYYYQGDYEGSMENFLKALKIFEEINDREKIAATCNNIGNIYNTQGKYQMALEYHFKSLKIRTEMDDKRGIATSFNNIGEVYRNLGNIAFDANDSLGGKAKYDSSMANYMKGLAIREKIGDKNGLSTSYNNVGIIHEYRGKYALHLGDPKSSGEEYRMAMQYYLKALKMDEELGNRAGMVAPCINIGTYYSKQKNFTEAAVFLNRALEISREIGYREYERDACSGLSELHEAMGDYRKSLEYHRIFKTISDSLVNTENSRHIAEMDVLYESAKKESQIKLMEKDMEKNEAESKRQRMFLLLMISVSVAVALIAFVVFRTLRVTQKQKLIIEKQKRIVDEKNKEITDSLHYAQKIQEAILTSEQYLSGMFLPRGMQPSHFILYKPKDIVAGDFYWAYLFPDNIAVWAVADCTGHGVPGAFMSMIGNTLLNEIVIENRETESDMILNKLRDSIIKALRQSEDESQKKDALAQGIRLKDGMDISLCVWNKKTNLLQYSGANNPLWVIRNEKLIELKPDKQPVGYYSEHTRPFTKKELILRPGDTLYSLSDGYEDQFGGPKGKKFKSARLKELLLSIRDKPMPEQNGILKNTFEKWKGDLEQIDDICIFGVRV